MVIISSIRMKRGFLLNINDGNKRDDNSDATEKSIIKNYKLDKIIGTGNLTEVYLAYNTISGNCVAVKVANKTKLRAYRKEEDILNEKNIGLQLNNPGHSNVLRLLETFVDKENVYISYEYCQYGELWQYIMPFGFKPERTAKLYLAQLLLAVEYIHSKNIVHRDIKAENCFLSSDKTLKLGDFGTALALSSTKCTSKNCKLSCPCRFNMVRGRRQFKYYVGTPQFMAPESIKNQPVTFSADIWSYGCTVFQVLSGFPPFNAPSEFLVCCRVLDLKLNFPPDFPKLAKDLVLSILKKDPYERPTINAIKQHEYFKDINFQEIHKEFISSTQLLSLTELCLLKMTESYKGQFSDEYIDNLNLSINTKLSLKRLNYDIQRRIYEGPRDTWEEEFIHHIKLKNDSTSDLNK
ncbi:protein kinase domain-containing protein [Cryptosporidium muris RN66]|uniref:Protein kinase domain-containing protein n=1 Tax=Cryptosporidium muris (strain RN66) TaxID=441375 RepID=B6AI26_CRYMR|nr:protein kinase domain-containing protein [Cryptosporidium muris RN66]EEA07867.1 protein kinase domain-containing protein [Cryptosporidium muris RN66]|eukprot:XP_002142216.1 protein kinase domain-containing protein [Cryptosporidium muris RN66]